MITIDLGLHGCGVAFWPMRKDPVLTHAGYLRQLSPGVFGMAWTLKESVHPQMQERVIIERPRIYTKMKGDPADILNLLEVGATFQGMLGRPVEWIEPHAWKGSIDADQMTERIRSRLSTGELKNIDPCPKSLEHNVLDACGIGLHALGRLDRKRVIAR
jgi:hypothetical protein